MGYRIAPSDGDPFADGRAKRPVRLEVPPTLQEGPPGPVPDPGPIQALRDVARDPAAPWSRRIAATVPLALGEEASGIVTGLASALRAPGDILAGKLRPDDPRFFESAAIGVPGLMLGAGAPAAEEGALGVFGGRLSPKADIVKLELAQKLKESGASTSHIWRTTGWFEGMDGKWRFEIPDIGTKFKAGARQVMGDEQYYVLEDLIEHPGKLFEYYPQLRSAPARVLSPEGMGRVADEGADLPLGRVPTALHEIQHLIQEIEGFTGGTSPWSPAVEAAAPTLGVDPYGLYRRASGEVESRNVADRFSRRNYAPEPRTTEDTPHAQQHMHEMLQLFVDYPELFRSSGEVQMSVEGEAPGVRQLFGEASSAGGPLRQNALRRAGNFVRRMGGAEPELSRPAMQAEHDRLQRERAVRLARGERIDRSPVWDAASGRWVAGSGGHLAEIEAELRKLGAP